MKKIILAQELLEQDLSQRDVSERLEISRRAVIRWEQAVQAHGSLEAFLKYYQHAKASPHRKRKGDQVRAFAFENNLQYLADKKSKYGCLRDQVRAIDFAE